MMTYSCSFKYIGLGYITSDWSYYPKVREKISITGLSMVLPRRWLSSISNWICRLRCWI